MSSLFPAVSLISFASTALSLYVIIVVRYFAIAGLFYWLLWKRQTRCQKLQDTSPAPERVRYEIKWSVITSLIFALPGAYMIEAWKLGGTLVYFNVAEYGWLYLALSLAFFMFLHDTYFYWTHRWLHKPGIYRIFHKVHHNSPNPTPWAAFSFHPYEGILEAIIIPALVFFMPVHVSVLLFALLAMTFFSVVNHTGYEIYPPSWMKGAWAKWMITPTHHNLHHKLYNCNYALYFRFWDYWMGTDQWPENEVKKKANNRHENPLKGRPELPPPPNFNNL